MTPKERIVEVRGTLRDVRDFDLDRVARVALIERALLHANELYEAFLLMQAQLTEQSRELTQAIEQRDDAYQKLARAKTENMRLQAVIDAEVVL